MKMAHWRTTILPGLIFIVVFVSVVYLAKRLSENRGDAKLQELQKLLLEIPAFPGFSRIDTQHSSRFLDAGIYNYYSSAASYEEVRRYYVATLIEKGWMITGEEGDQSSPQLPPRKITFANAGITQLTFYGVKG
ncbi:MAG TPA: hypothetical protein VJT71_03965 [Pyrinomonadaceae bacterium]|nr:hypothetical protein [Pyrinomonadaceae bacterium]